MREKDIYYLHITKTQAEALSLLIEQYSKLAGMANRFGKIKKQLKNILLIYTLCKK